MNRLTVLTMDEALASAARRKAKPDTRSPAHVRGAATKRANFEAMKRERLEELRRG